MQTTIPRILFASLLLLPAVCGCSKPAAPPPSPAATEKSEHYLVGVSLTRIDEPWPAQLKADIEAAAAKHPDLRLVVEVADNDAAKQLAQLNDFQREGVKAIIIRPVEAQALTEPVAKLVDAGIPVIVLDRALIGDKYTCFIAPDYKEIGAVAGRWLAEHLDGKGRIVELKGPVVSLRDQEMFAAFRSALLDPGYRFVFDAHVDPPRTDAGKLMSEALDNVEKIDAVFAFDDAAAYAACETAKAAKREKSILFVGVGGVPSQGATYVADGALTASVLAPTGGTRAIEAVVKALDGQKVPKTIVPQVRVITKESP